MTVDFKQINENIVKEGLSLEYITIIYNDLTPKEAKEIYLKQGIIGLSSFEKRMFDEGIKSGKNESIEMFLREHEGAILSGYPKDMKPLYPKKAVGVHTLEA